MPKAFQGPQPAFVPADEQDSIYVGKHGNDANSGLNIDSAKLTIQAGIDTAVANGAAVGSPYVVKVTDAGIYDEALTLAAYVHVYAPNATIQKSAAGGSVITATANTRFTCAILDALAGQVGYSHSIVGTGYLTVDVMNAGDGIGVLALNVGTIINYRGRQLYVNNGVGIGDGATDVGHLHVELEDIYITGTGTGVVRFGAGDTIGSIQHIRNTGAGTGRALWCISGVLALDIQDLNTTIAIQVGAAGIVRGTIAMLEGGTRIYAAGASVSIIFGNIGYPYGDLETITNAEHPYTILDTDGTIRIDTTAGIVDVVLPAALNRQGQITEIVWVAGVNVARILTTGADTVDGAANFTIAALRDAFTSQSDGVSDWAFM